MVRWIWLLAIFSFLKINKIVLKSSGYPIPTARHIFTLFLIAPHYTSQPFTSPLLTLRCSWKVINTYPHGTPTVPLSSLHHSQSFFLPPRSTISDVREPLMTHQDPIRLAWLLIIDRDLTELNNEGICDRRVNIALAQSECNSLNYVKLCALLN